MARQNTNEWADVAADGNRRGDETTEGAVEVRGGKDDEESTETEAPHFFLQKKRKIFQHIFSAKKTKIFR